MTSADHYTYRITWSAEDEAYVSTVAEFPSLSWIDTDRTAALTGIEALLQDVLDDMAESGETPPMPLADRVYSGRFQVRIPPEVHRRLATEAAEQGVSLNRLVSSRLAGCRGRQRPLTGSPATCCAPSTTTD